MTLALSSDKGYKGPKLNQADPGGNRVPLIAKLGGAPKGHVFRELPKMPFSVLAQRCKGSLPWMRNRPPTLHAISTRCNAPIDQFACRTIAVTRSKCLGSCRHTDSDCFGVKNSSASANMTWRPRARPPICPAAKCRPCRVRDMPARRTERKRRDLKRAIRVFIWQAIETIR